MFKTSKNCNNTANITKCSRRNTGFSYVCTSRKCKTIFPIQIFKNDSIKTQPYLLLRAIYCVVLEYDNSQAVSTCEISAPTYIKIKKEILKELKKFNKNNTKIGGKDIEVHLDETAICNGKIITCPSQSLDKVAGIQWIVGGVEKENGRNLFMTLVPNRKSETLLSVFENFIVSGSILVTDGYPPYTSAVKMFDSRKIVVNHTNGFKNDEGYTTNKLKTYVLILKRCTVREMDYTTI
jgi:hypothetical protein